MALLRGGDRAGDQARYEVRVVGSYLGASSEKQTPYVEIVFEDDNGDRLSAFKYLTEGAWPYVEKDLETLGWKGAEHSYAFEELDGGEDSALAGAEAQIVVTEEEYEGKVRPKVAFINESGGRPREMMSEKESASFAERIRQRLGVGPKRSPRGRGSARKERDARVRKAAADGAARQRKSKDDAGQAPESEPKDDDYDFDEIPF